MFSLQLFQRLSMMISFIIINLGNLIYLCSLQNVFKKKRTYIKFLSHFQLIHPTDKENTARRKPKSILNRDDAEKGSATSVRVPISLQGIPSRKGANFNVSGSPDSVFVCILFGLVVFYGISTHVGYLMPNPVYTYI